MSLYQGIYRRNRCSTRQPAKPGWYHCWFKGRENHRDYYWNGKEWQFQVGNHQYGKAAFGNFAIVMGNCLWAEIPASLSKPLGEMLSLTSSSTSATQAKGLF